MYYIVQCYRDIIIQQKRSSCDQIYQCRAHTNHQVLCATHPICTPIAIKIHFVHDQVQRRHVQPPNATLSYPFPPQPTKTSSCPSTSPTLWTWPKPPLCRLNRLSISCSKFDIFQTKLLSPVGVADADDPREMFGVVQAAHDGQDRAEFLEGF